MFLPFEEWTPDKAAINSGMVRVMNLLPTVEGYETAPSLLPTSYPTLPDQPRMVKAFRSSDGSVFTFAFCLTHIYMLRTLVSWTDVTRVSAVYATPTSSSWWVVQWGDTIYCGNGADLIQKFDMNGGSTFDDVPGSPVATIGVVIGDFLVLFNCRETVGGPSIPYRMWWSGRLRPETFIPSLVTQAGYRDVSDIGFLVQAVGGDYGLVTGQTGMQRIDYIGPPVQFQLSRVDEDVGCLFRETMIKIAGTTYFFSTRGWRASVGGPSIGIGMGKVDAYTRQRMSSEKSYLISNFIFPDKSVFAISYVSPDSSDGYPDEVIYYNFDVKRFSHGRMRVLALGTLGNPPLYVDDAVYGELAVDDPIFGETLIDITDDLKFTIVGVSPDDRSLMMLQETQPAAELETRELQLVPGLRAQVTRTRLIGEGFDPVYTVRVVGRDRLIAEEISKDPFNVAENTGSVAQNKRGRYHRFDVSINGRFKSLIGLEIEFSPAGRS